MSDLGTVRERIQRASEYFHRIDGAVLTTFNLSAPFLEEHALPAILGVEGKTAAARRADLHQRLAVTPCTVFYDPTVPPRLSGRYRYVARPVPVRGRFFHPKMVILAGESESGVTWVYLAVSSANLTLSGWGRNGESFGETWIHTRRQESWHTLDGALAWLAGRAHLGDSPSDMDAVARVRAALDRMPDRKRFADDDKEPWYGSLYARLYMSVVHTDGFPTFLQRGRVRRPAKMWAYSPYWSEVAENVAAFNAHETVLVPALRADGKGLGLSRGQAGELGPNTVVRRNPGDVGTRFFHMKAYWIRHTSKIYTAVGSCNFTRAGLAGVNGNIEAMLMFKADPEWLPDGDEPSLEDMADDELAEEEAPQPTPVAIVVAWDWRAYTWRWWLDAGPGQRDFQLHLPGLAPFVIDAGTQERAGTPPARGAVFTITYHMAHGARQWRGAVVELNLDHSSRTYGRSLTANEILESWCGRAPTWDLGGGTGDSGTGDESDTSEDIEPAASAAFDAVNLYDLYRSMRSLREKLADLDERPDIQRAYLVGRPDSVMALAHLADREGEARVVRYLVLRELICVLAGWARLLDDSLVARARDMAHHARERTLEQLSAELGTDAHRADTMLDWFEDQLGRLNRGGTP